MADDILSELEPDRLGVCLGGYADHQPLLNAARKQAERLDIPWFVIHIELENQTTDPLIRQRLDHWFDWAQEAGANIVRIPSKTVAEGIIVSAELYKLSHIIIGKSTQSDVKNFIEAPVASKLLKSGGPFEIQIMDLAPAENTVLSSAPGGWRPYAMSVGLIAALSVVVEFIQESVPEYQFNASIYNVSMVYLLMIVFCAVRYGFRPAILASVLSFGLYNFFFIPPFYEFGLGQVSDAVNFLLFLSASLISATAANLYKRNISELKDREFAARALYDLSKDVAGSGKIEEVVISLADHLEEILSCDVVLTLDSDNNSKLNINTDNLTERATRNAQKAYETQEIVTGDNWTHYPISTPRRDIGIMSLKQQEQLSLQLIEALCYQAALAIERAQLMQDSEKMELQSQKENLRSALLSSVSHDLKTPLVSIIGSLSSMRHMEHSLSDEDRRDLLNTAIEEAERLNQSITNILNMTRIEAGDISPDLQWIELTGLYRDAIQRLSNQLTEHKVTLSAAETAYEINVDPVLFPQVLQNLLENFGKYTPDGSELILAAIPNDNSLILTLTDNGPGIPASDREKVFDKFSRLEQRDARVAGTGLGLSICKSIVKLHNGHISLQDTPTGQGLMVQVTLNEYRPVKQIEADQ